MTVAGQRRRPKSDGKGKTFARRKSLLAFDLRGNVLLASALAFVVEIGFVRQPAVVTLSGLWLLLGAPIVVWQSLLGRAIPSRSSRSLVAVGFAIATLLGTALAVNTLLPIFGIASPLTRGWLASASFTAVLVLLVVHRKVIGAGHQRVRHNRGSWRGLGAVATLGGVSLFCAVAGALRLNKGYDSSVSLACLLMTAALIVLLLVRRGKHGKGTAAVGVYLVAASLLLLTSLRGSYITGHDVQAEFRFFKLAASAGHWDISGHENAYNSCLSVTLLPVSLSRLTEIPDIYVFKVVMPLLFALTPVLVYCACRNFAPKLVALLSAIYFMAFPTFFSDMPFMARQEVAFLFLGCAVLVLTEGGRRTPDPRPRPADEGIALFADGPTVVRRLAFTALLLGVVVSHYSTTYLVLAVLAASFVAGRLLRAIPPVWRRVEYRTSSPPSDRFIRWWMIAVVAAATLFWTGPATHTSGQLQETVSDAVQTVLHPGKEFGSSDTAYIFFAPHRPSGQERLVAYANRLETDTQQARQLGRLEPLSVVKKSFASPAAQEPAVFPLTQLGRALDSRGVDVEALHTALRWFDALLLQMLLLLGLLKMVIGRSPALRPPSLELLLLAVGSIAMIALQTLLPPLSVNYGLLRSFQQGLFFLAPFIALGSIVLTGRKSGWPVLLSVAFAVTFYLNTTGVTPALLGGGPAKLHLYNGGREYDIYFDHEQERSAFTWMRQRLNEVEDRSARPSIQTDWFTFQRMPMTLRSDTRGNNFPTAIRKNSYVLLGYTTVRKNKATLVLNGDLVTYSYPVEFLDLTKNKVYSSDGASVYSPGIGDERRALDPRVQSRR